MPFAGRAHAEDHRGGCRAERQPQHAARVGASFRLPEAAALAGQAPPLHARGSRRAARRAPGGAVDLVGDLPRARGAERDTSVLVGALPSFELDRADAAMEAALALRSVERSVEEVLLPSVDELGERHGFDSAPWAFAARWADDWLQRAQRLAPPPMRPAAVLIGDATARRARPRRARPARARALLRPRRRARARAAGHRRGRPRRRARARSSPQVVVVAGAEAPDDEVARWAYRVRSAAGALRSTLFRRGRVERGRDRRAPARRVARRGAPRRSSTCSTAVPATRRVRAHDEPTLDAAAQEGERMSAAPAARRASRLRRAAASDVQFCGHCGRAAAIDIAAPASRVCGALRDGAAHRRAVRARARARAIRSCSSTRRCRSAACPRWPRSCSASSRPRRSTATSTSCSCRPTPRRRARGDLVNLLVHAARGDGEVHDVVLRPTRRVRHPLLGPHRRRAGRRAPR